MKIPFAIELCVALFDTSLAVLCFALGCAVVIASLPPELVADSEPVPASFDVAMPAWEAVAAGSLVVAAGN